MNNEDIRAIVHQVFEELKKEQINIVEDMLNAQTKEQNQKMLEYQAYVKKLREDEENNKEDWRTLKYKIIFWSITSVTSAIFTVVGYAVIHFIGSE